MLKPNSFQWRFALPVAMLILFSNIAIAQINLPVSGQVISADGGLPLDGVTVSLENTGIGSVTNSDGKFTIVLHATVMPTDSITFTYIGYNTKKVSAAVAFASNNLTVKLEASVTNLAEVKVKPLSLQALLDSIINHNSRLLISPVELKGYYREMVYTNAKCTEYSDALCAYFYDRSAIPNGQFKIDASRCLMAKEEKSGGQNYQAMTDSFIPPNDAFKITLIINLIRNRFAGKLLDGYGYRMAQADAQNNGDFKITISPKVPGPEEFYELTLFLKNDFTLKSYRLTVPESFVSVIKEKNFLGIHAKVTAFDIIVNYASLHGGIYPNYYYIALSMYMHGKFFGTTINQTIKDRSEFASTEVDDSGGVKPFERKVVYKKGNICKNGAAINDALLKNYTIIKLSQKDSVAIQSFVDK